MLFREVIGQESVKHHLREMYAGHRIPHASLFVGPEGSGSFALALAFAQYINCTGDKSSGDSCGQCPSCRKYSILSHPDLHFVYPVKRRDDHTDSDTYIGEWREFVGRSPYFSLAQWTDEMSGNVQALISKNDAVTIHRKLSMKPYEAQYQVLIMWKPELMNETAANRILKILEEPPSNTLFMLVSESSAEILPTILSRTQIIKVPTVDEDDLVKAISAMYQKDEAEARHYAHMANGNVLTAMGVMDDAEESRANLDFFTLVMRTCYTRNVMDMMGMAEEFSKKFTREQLKNRLVYSQRMLRENLVMNLGNGDLNFMTPAEEAFSSKFSRFVHLDNVFKMSQLFDDATAHIEQNGNASIILMDLFLQLTVCLKVPRPE